MRTGPEGVEHGRRNFRLDISVLTWSPPKLSFSGKNSAPHPPYPPTAKK